MQKFASTKSLPYDQQCANIHWFIIITFPFPFQQNQSNTADCGVFAIAYATAICYGQDPEKLLFNTSRMRNHLCNCLEDQNIWQFPATLTDSES